MFSGTKAFSDLAIYFTRHGKYPYEDEYNQIFDELNPDPKKTAILPSFDDFSPEMQEFATFWIDKFVNGDSVGGVFITGEHSFYLNCCWITRTLVDEFGKKRRGGGFPDFWDEDYKYFWTCDIARWGVSWEKYEQIKAPCNFNLIETEENIVNGGLDNLYGKPRGVGASWKGGSYANYNMFLVPESNTFILADKDAYLDGDGLYKKFDTLRSFIVKHCWWLKKNFVKESLSDFHYETGLKSNVGGAKSTSGFATKVLGVVIDGDKEKARGVRGNFLFEEFGSFPNVDNVWLVTDPGVQEYGVVYGQRRGFGTGGDAKGGLMSLEKMLYDPTTYRLIQFKNIYEEFKGNICYFSPAYRNITHKDEHGNSDEAAGKEWLAKEEAKLDGAKDPTILTKFRAEYCTKPGDMFKNAGVNILPIELADEQLTFLERTNFDRKQCSYGKLTEGHRQIVFTPVMGALPYEEFPATTGDRTGCIAIFKQPFKKSNGLIPNDLYIISVDGYTQDKDGGKSIGSVRVLEQPNKFTRYLGDCVVAWYDGRPEGFDGLNEFAKQIFYLAEFYNAQIMIENDQVGDVISYAKKNTDSKGRKLTIYLADQPDLAFDEKIQMKKTMNRTFGMNMTEQRKIHGLKYYQEWLLKPRGVTSEGKLLLNIHMEMSRGMLREIKYFNGENADRISSMIIAMYHLRETEHKFTQSLQTSNRVIQTLNLF